jgi:hypothetical protein
MAIKNLEEVAIGKAVSSKDLTQACRSLPPGEYEVDLMVHILGKIHKGEPHMAKVVNRIDWCLLFSLAMSKVNSSTRTAIFDLVAAVVEAGPNGKQKALAAQVKEQVQVLVDDLKGLTEQEVAGKTITDLGVEVMAARCLAGRAA